MTDLATDSSAPPAQREQYLLVVFAALTLALGITGAITLEANPVLYDWSLTHWAFSYDHGFARRSLVGEVVTSLVAPSDLHATAKLISLASSILVSIGLAWFFWRPFLRHRRAGLLGFALLATTHFATLQHFFYDLGRFDHFGLLLAMVCLLAIERLRGLACSLVVLAACSLGILVHEVFLVLFAPLVFAYWILRQPEGGWFAPRRLIVGLLMMALVVFTVLEGGIDLPRESYLAELRQMYGGWIMDGSVGVLYGGARTEIPRALHMMISPRRMAEHLILVAALVPTMWLMVKGIQRLLGDLGESARRAWLLVFVAALSPLAMHLIGIDFARWWALAITNLFLAFALHCADPASDPARLDDSPLRGGIVLWGVLVMNLVCGPIGVAASAFPRLEPYIVGFMKALIHWVRT